MSTRTESEPSARGQPQERIGRRPLVSSSMPAPVMVLERRTDTHGDRERQGPSLIRAERPASAATGCRRRPIPADLQPHDRHSTEVGEVPVLGPNLSTMCQGRCRNPGVVDSRLAARPKLSCSQPCVSRSHVIVRRQASGLLTYASQRGQSRGSRLTVPGHQDSEFQLRERDYRDSHLVRQRLGQWAILFDRDEHRRIQYGRRAHLSLTVSWRKGARSRRSPESAAASRITRSIAGPVLQSGRVSGTRSATGLRFTLTRSRSPASTRRSTSAVWFRRSRADTSAMATTVSQLLHFENPDGLPRFHDLRHGSFRRWSASRLRPGPGSGRRPSRRS
jgi:hypothetical protein